MEERKRYSYGKIKHFTDIEAWKLARKLRVEIYGIIKELPSEERFDLGSQMRKAAVSCTANIAEGHGRFHFQENIQFCRQSRGSMYETQDHLVTCLDRREIGKEKLIGGLKMTDLRLVSSRKRQLKPLVEAALANESRLLEAGIGG